MSLLMIMFLVMIVSRTVGAALGGDPWRRQRRMRRQWQRMLEGDDMFHPFSPPAPPMKAPPQSPLQLNTPPVAAPPRAETRLESLQRRFASGELSIEEYERSVGDLYGLKGE